jgi:hypothetical protein
MNQLQIPMLEALHAAGPVLDYAPQMMLYGQFVGSWDGRLVIHRKDGSRLEMESEVHFGWVLEGRAIQDVWIAPPQSVRQNAEFTGQAGLYGTTLRVYDPSSDLWHIIWVDPATQDYRRMIGQKQGEDIFQEYIDKKGLRCQWCFTEITTNSFHWLWRESKPEREAWNIRYEFFMQRRETGSHV